MLSVSLKKQIVSVIALALIACSGSFMVPQENNSSPLPAVEATGVIG
jgi:hypothetical protein